MRIITKNQKIAEVPELWRKQHTNIDTGAWQPFNGAYDPYDMHYRLCAATTEQEITAIIGNDSFTRLQCTICRNNVDRLIELREYIFICPACIAAARELVNG